MKKRRYKYLAGALLCLAVINIQVPDTVLAGTWKKTAGGIRRMMESGRRGSGKRLIINGIILMRMVTALPDGERLMITGMILTKTVCCRPDDGSMSIMWEPMAGC